jgi:L-rhamnose-H+ transport protein
MDAMTTGLIIVLLAGVFQGSFMLPSKWMKGWSWENYWLIFAFTAYVLCPWLLALATIPKLLDVYRTATPASLLVVAGFGACWGIGAITFGLGVEALGIALGFAVILGVAAIAGAVIPLVVLTPETFSVGQAIALALSLGMMLLGLTVCSFAGRWKEAGSPTQQRRSYRRGLALGVLSGLLSACGNLGFAFGQGVTHAARELGAAQEMSANALWALLAFPLFLCNAGYALYLLGRNKTFTQFRNEGSTRRTVLAMTMGILWMAGFAFYGIGAWRLGPLGTSLGFAVLMSSMILTANAQGVLTGEWRGAPAHAKKQLAAGIVLLILAMAGLGYANGLQ